MILRDYESHSSLNSGHPCGRATPLDFRIANSYIESLRIITRAHVVSNTLKVLSFTQWVGV